MRQPKINKPVKKTGLSTVGKNETEDWFCIKVSALTKQQFRSFRSDLNAFCKEYFVNKEDKDY